MKRVRLIATRYFSLSLLFLFFFNLKGDMGDSEGRVSGVSVVTDYIKLEVAHFGRDPRVPSRTRVWLGQQTTRNMHHHKHSL